MLWPIAEATDAMHHHLCRAIPMLSDPALNRRIEVKGTDGEEYATKNKKQQPKPALLCHSQISRLSFNALYS